MMTFVLLWSSFLRFNTQQMDSTDWGCVKHSETVHQFYNPAVNTHNSEFVYRF